MESEAIREQMRVLEKVVEECTPIINEADNTGKAFRQKRLRAKLALANLKRQLGGVERKERLAGKEN